MNRFTNMRNPDEYTMTIGVEFGVHSIKLKNKLIKFHIWDTARQETFRAITRSYYNGATCAIVMYDISNRESFKNVESWLNEMKETCVIEPEIAIFANKNDLASKRQVTYEEGEQLAKNHNLFFLEGSAKWNTNVDKAFTLLADAMLSKIIYREINEGEFEKRGIRKGTGAVYQNYVDINDYDKSSYSCCQIM